MAVKIFAAVALLCAGSGLCDEEKPKTPVSLAQQPGMPPMMGQQPPMPGMPPMMGQQPPMQGMPPMMGQQQQMPGMPPMMGQSTPGMPPMMGPQHPPMPPMQAFSMGQQQMPQMPPMMGQQQPQMPGMPPMMGQQPPMPPMMGQQPPMPGQPRQFPGTEGLEELTATKSEKTKTKAHRKGKDATLEKAKDANSQFPVYGYGYPQFSPYYYGAYPGGYGGMAYGGYGYYPYGYGGVAYGAYPTVYGYPSLPGMFDGMPGGGAAAVAVDPIYQIDQQAAYSAYSNANVAMA